MTDDAEGFKRRFLDTPGEIGDYERTLIAELVKLRDRTHPDGGGASAVGKDLAAFQALNTAMRLVEVLAGWAVDHQAGLASEGLSFVPLQPPATKQHPDYLAARAVVDDHRHEMTGAAMYSEDITPEIARRLLVNMSEVPYFGGLESAMCMLNDALLDLNYGKLHPLFRTPKKHRKVNRLMHRLQLRAVGFVAYRHALSSRKSAAWEEVASAYGVNAETARNWEKDLRQELGHLEVARQYAFARGTASNVLAARRARAKGNTSLGYLLEDGERAYGSQALAKAGASFQAAMREKGEKA